MNPIPFNVSVIQSNSYLRLDDSRQCLVSQSGKTLHRWDEVASKPGSVVNKSLIKELIFGGVTITYCARWIAFKSVLHGKWGINTIRFAGTPKLKVEPKNNNSEILITLKRASFPGLDISADLTARLYLDGTVAMMELQFDFCGFKACVGLADWLDHKTKAIAPVLLDDQLCRLTEGLKLTVAGGAIASFGPAWLFLFASNTSAPFVTLTTQGHAVESNSLALALLAPGIPSLIRDNTVRRSLLFIPESRGFDLPLWPEHSAAWQFDRNPVFLPFHWLGIEADERVSDGRKRRALVAMSAPADFVLFRPAGERLKNDRLEPFVIPLHLPIYVVMYLGDGTRLGGAFVALRGTDPLTVHTHHCSLTLGPIPKKPGFLLYQNDVTGETYLGPLPDGNGNLQPGLRFMLIASAQRPGEDVVVDPVPPLVPNVMTLTINPLDRPLYPLEGEIHVGAPTDDIRITLPNFIWTQIVRPRDLMVLGFQFLGLRPEFIGDNPGRLVRASLKDAPRIIVYFPPQNITERAACQNQSCKSETLEDSCLNGFPVIAPHRTAGLSRLVFDLPSGANEAPYTLPQLLDWSGDTLKPRLDGRALSPLTIPDITGHVAHVAPKAFDAAKLLHGYFKPVAESTASETSTPITDLLATQPPALDVTAIEAPYRLLISPDQLAKWEHSISSAMATGSRAVLWHTRLESRFPDATPVIRALYAVDDIAGVTPAPLEPPPGAETTPANEKLRTSLTAENRRKIVVNSTLKPVTAKKLMLTAQGAWLDFEADWSQQYANDLVKWEHRATLGRDQFVKIIERGYAYPFGHRLLKITITERRFGQRPIGRVGAWMRQREFYIVAEYERFYIDESDKTTPAYPSQSKEMPFRSVRILTKVTPLIDDPPSIGAKIPPHGQWLEVLDTDFLFSMSATDREGNAIEFSAPLAFIPFDADQAVMLEYSSKAIDTKNDPPNREGRRCYDFNGQKIAYTEGTDGNSTLETGNITFSATTNETWSSTGSVPPFFPKIVSAKVFVPALRQFAAQSEPQTIRYAQTYLTDGYGGQNAQGQIFAQIEGGVAFEYGKDNPADKVGGLATPGMTAGGLSRTHGVVGTSGSDPTSVATTLATFAKGTFNPADYFGQLSAKLLGGITLIDILESNLPFDTANPAIPRWTTTYEGEDIVNRLSWETPALHSALFFHAEPGAKLVLANEIRVKADAPDNATSTSSATISNFALDLLDLIKIPFTEFSMTTVAGRKPEVNVKLGSIEFCGKLKFLAEIQDKLQLDKFADPPCVDVSAAGLSIGYTLQIPSIQVGVFALRNLALSAQATLPFNGDPFRTRFALSERQSPFLISVSLFTGGGFFALSLGLDGVECLEVSLEFGGSFSLDIGVASGGVYVMAGVYFKHESNAAALTGYVRAGGSLCVIGLITVSVEFYLGLKYQQGTGSGKVWGEASMTVEVEVLFFSTDVTLTVRREFAGDAVDPTLRDTHTADEWDNYIAAFAV